MFRGMQSLFRGETATMVCGEISNSIFSSNSETLKLGTNVHHLINLIKLECMMKRDESG